MIINGTITHSTALRRLCPTAAYVLRGTDVEFVEELNSEGNPVGTVITPNLEWLDTTVEKPTKEQLDAEVERLKQEYAATEYQRLRQPEYPPLSDLADALYWQSQGDNSKMEKYLAAVDAVKQKYPKGIRHGEYN
jgi:hypothetical protein